MNDNEILTLWKTYDQQLKKVLAVNQQMAEEVTQLKVKKLLSGTARVKKFTILVGCLFLALCWMAVIAGLKAGAVFFTVGFGAIALINASLVIAYFYHLYLIQKIDTSDSIVSVQENLSRLKISGFKITRLSLVQIPCWFVCWISYDAFLGSFWSYGVISIFFVLGSGYGTYWLFKNLHIDHLDSKISRLFFSGLDWDPIVQSVRILEQVKAYKN